MGEPLVVWDFDWSLVNENSDVYVIEALEGHGGPVWTQAVLQWRESGGKLPGGWTALMDSCVENLWAAGVREPEFTEALGGIPMLSGADKAARLVQARGVDQRILSDANEYYIRAILDAKGLADGVFSSVITNRGAFDGPDGRLTINPFHPLDASSHGCPHCPSNLCKGAILRQWMAEVSPSKVLYVGDGANDFCPALLLEHPGSVVLARGAPHDRLLEKCTKSIADGTLKGMVVEWSEADNGAALLQTITNFLNSS